MNAKALAIVSPSTTALAQADDHAVVDFPSLVAMGDQLVRTNFLPDHIKTGAQFAAIVMTGKELGMTTMRSCRSLSLVKGKVIEDAASQLARFKAAGGRAEFKTLDETKAVLWLKHPNGDEHTETWSVEDSKRAGLSGGNHEKFRKAMLRSRVITSGLKSLGWDGAVGAYDASEMEMDEAPRQPVSVVEKDVLPTPAAKAKRPPNMSGVVDLAEVIAGADAEGLSFAMDNIEGVAGDSEKVTFALKSLISQRTTQIEDLAWEGTEQEAAAVKWLRGEMEKRAPAVAPTEPTTAAQ